MSRPLFIGRSRGGLSANGKEEKTHRMINVVVVVVGITIMQILIHINSNLIEAYNLP